MEPEEETRIIQKFIKELIALQLQKFQSLPDWIHMGFDWIDQENGRLKDRHAKWHEYLKLLSYRRQLEKFTKLDVFGFNCSTFDIPAIAGALFLHLKKLCGKVQVLRKSTAYISVSTPELCFKDAYRFTSPCSYEKFVKSWEAQTFKSIWPYTLYHSVAEIKAAKKFPPLSDFASSLKGDQKPEMADYIIAKREFYRRKLLPVGHPDRICSMLGFLRFYNIQDVVPLVKALENCFDCYYNYFQVNPILSLSLPGLAQEAMFKSLKQDSPLIFTFSEKNKEINKIFRSQVYGGLVNVFRRHVTTIQDASLPHNAQFAADGNPFTSIVALDFTSMYLTCQKQLMPTSPGLLWERNANGTFKKNVMCEQHSFKCQQWLCYKQEHGKFYFKDNVLL